MNDPERRVLRRDDDRALLVDAKRGGLRGDDDGALLVDAEVRHVS